MGKLSPKQQRFVAEYLKDHNATKAAIRAGYAKRSAAQQASRLLMKDEISLAVQKGIQKVEISTGITKERVLLELGRIAFFDIRRLYKDDGSMKAPNELDDDAAAVLTGLEVTEEFEGYGEDRHQIGHTKKAKIADKGKAIELAMRHLGLLKDKILGEDDEPLLPTTITVERKNARLSQ